MEPLSCVSKKRKDNSSTTQEDVKRLKTDIENDETIEYECHRHCPRISVPLSHLQEPITLKELTELLQFATLGKSGGVQQPSWCRLHHQRRVTGVNVVVLEGLTQSHFYKHFLTLRHLRTKYTTRLSFTPSSNDLVTEIFNSEVPRLENVSVSRRDHSAAALKWHPVIRNFGTETRGLTAYTLSQEEMIKKHFPVKGMPGFEAFVGTDSDDYVTDSSPLYGLDCEMCLTEKGYEVARVSLVDSSGKCLLDELVKPQNRVLNYLTKFSGITAAMLRPITTTLREVQTKVRMLLPRDAVLVGHSVDNDLRALELIHPHVIDTSLLYRREFGQKFKLKVLAEVVLNKQIQIEEKQGHDPTEDAMATLELAQYFIKTGPQRVVELHLDELWGGFPALHESTVRKPTVAQSTRFADVLQRSGRSVAYIGKRGDITLALSNQQWHCSDREVLASFRRSTKCPSFSLLQFSSFSDHLKNSFPQQDHHYRTVRAHLRSMCVVFAGPFPAGFSERDVRRLFRCCGAVEKIRMLNTSFRIHAEIEFALLEGATLALKTRNGLNVHGQSIKVQRPVDESALDLDVMLDALKEDPLNANLLYAVGLKPNANQTHGSPLPNGCTTGANRFDVAAVKTANRSQPVTVNGSTTDVYHSDLRAAAGDAGSNGATRLRAGAASLLSEEKLREAFGRFGVVEGICPPAVPCGKRARHARIRFQSPEGVQAALGSSAQNYLVCPALTPGHLRSWVAAATPATRSDAEEEAAAGETGRELARADPRDMEMERVMRKLDYRLHKLFKSLPDHTLSVVLLPGHISSHGYLPGLCFMDVNRGSS
ncbi:RNA exonuclease 5 isoform 1-T2 [Polymixia lowei]